MMRTPNCFKRGCIYLLGVKQPEGTEEEEVVYCAAFPDGVPDNIAYGDELHLSPVAGQLGTITFDSSE